MSFTGTVDWIKAIQNRIKNASVLTGPDIEEIRVTLIRLERKQEYDRNYIAFLEKRLRDMHRRAQQAESTKAWRKAYEEGVQVGSWMTYEVAQEKYVRELERYKVKTRHTIGRFLNVVRRAALCLRYLLCDPEGKVAIQGSDEDRKIVQDVIEGLEKIS
jgi:hypothetical protein